MEAIRGRFRAAVLMGAAASVLAFAAGAKAQNQNFRVDPWRQEDSWLFGNPPPNDNPWPYATTASSPVLAVVGDIACQPGGEVETTTSGTTTTVTVLEPAGEAKSEFCFDPPRPPTPPPLCGSPRRPLRTRLRL